jgi:alginate O-acetyltransferase complex protein AlgI
MILERLGLSTLLKKVGLVGWIYTMIVVMIGWIFFRVESFSIALDFTIHLFGNNQNEQLNIWYFLDNENIVILLIGTLLSVHFLLNETNTFALHVKNLIQKFTLIRQSILLVLFLYCIALLNANSYNPFIYFKF